VATSKDCPVYAAQIQRIRNSPFPNLHNRKSLFVPRSTNYPPLSQHNPVILSTQNRFEALTVTEEVITEEDAQTDSYTPNTATRASTQHAIKHTNQPSMVNTVNRRRPTYANTLATGSLNP
jgi:hypothetical protein